MSAPQSTEALDDPDRKRERRLVLLARDDASIQPDAPPPRPANPARSLFHIASALVSLSFVLVVFSATQLAWVACSIAVTFWFLEAIRRPWPRVNTVLMRFFGPIAHPHETHKINSGTWYMTALALLALTRSPILCVAGVAVLGFGDPAASLIGRRFGRIRIARGRTLEGSLAFVVAGTLAATAGMLLMDPWPGRVGFIVAVAAVAAISGAIAELLSRDVDDNLSIPLVSSATLAIMLVVIGHPL